MAFLDTPDGYEVPLFTSLTQPILLGGVPRSFAIVNVTLSACLAIGMQLWWLGIPLGLVMHGVAYFFTKRDPYFFEILRRHLWQKPHYES
jgi:type IV secretion system protein TrbD